MRVAGMAAICWGHVPTVGRNSMKTWQGTGEGVRSTVAPVNKNLAMIQRRTVWKEFEEKPSAGYIWMVSTTPDVRYSLYYTKSPNDKALGRGNILIFSFTTENPQPRQVTMRLQRPWSKETLKTEHFYV